MKKTIWRLTIVAIVIGWAVLMLDLALERSGGVTSLLEDETDVGLIYPTGATSAASAVAGLAQESWFSILMHNKKIGHSRNSFRAFEDGFLFEDETVMKVKMMGALQEILTVTRAKLGPKFNLQNFKFTLTSPTTSIEVAGVLRGKSLDLEIVSAGSTSHQTLSLAEEPHLAIEIFPLLAKGGFKPGSRINLSVFDPSTLANDTMTVEVVEETKIKVGTTEIPAYHLRGKFKNIESESWVDRSGNLIREDSPLGFRVVRVTKRQALTEEFGGGASLDILDAAAIVVSRTIRDPRETKMLRVGLTGGKVNNFDFNDNRQIFEDGILTVNAENLDLYSYDVTFPVAVDKKIARYLKPEPFIQSDNPEIIETARQITAGETSARKAAEKLLKWVYENVEKTATLSLPSAYEVLKIRKGDCNEHAALLTALARAAGIPAKTLVGLVYLGDSFYYHAWVELYIGEWIAVDPAFGQFPADATHLKFVSGGLASQVEIVSVMGLLKIEVFESSR